jgi:hypothetical protein
MPLNRGTQKQIAQRFKGNLDYFRKAHYWRRLRFLTILIVTLAGAGAMAWLFFGGPDAMYNPGGISQHHAHFANDCAQCHEPQKKSLAGATLKFTNEKIDQRCEKCHASHSFHQPNVVHGRSCTACHQEHQGSGPMSAPGDAQCLKCHGDAHEMADSAAKGKSLAGAAFDYRRTGGWRIFGTPRPENGFTAVFTSFAADHPEFRLVADKLRETNTLKFNHKRHLAETNDIPLVNGQQLECMTCHQPGPGGKFFQRLSFDQHCRVCHSLQFDESNPDLTLPHGRAEHVRAFLHSLPTHYAELAQRRNAGRTKPEVDEFVSRQMLRLRDQFVDGTNLEREVFFTVLRRSPDGRTKFDGCATCHEVKPNANAAPVITLPSIPDRWMVRAHFDHGKHSSVACTKCHDAVRSKDTADVLMPSKAACVECHSPKGKVASNCSFCHSYHPPAAPAKVSSAP